MTLFPEQITIAVTVYSRRDFILEAISSALKQTVPVRVIVVEDCGPDRTLQDQVCSEFGEKIRYYRNQQRRGLFDNWNACLDYCSTPWISILHDDDLLCPDFIESILSLAEKAPDRALYFGRAAILDEKGRLAEPAQVYWPDGWREINPIELAERCFLMFPGQLFNIERARSIGGFRRNSYFTGDWDLWFRLVLCSGGAQSARRTSVARSHYGLDRGTSRVNRRGWAHCLDNIQRKRNLRLLSQNGVGTVAFDRTKTLKSHPVPLRLLLAHAAEFEKRILRYNARLFVNSTPPYLKYAMIQCGVRLFGPKLLRLLSTLWNAWHRRI